VLDVPPSRVAAAFHGPEHPWHIIIDLDTLKMISITEKIEKHY
jgi:hypothetical protein